MMALRPNTQSSSGWKTLRKTVENYSPWKTNKGAPEKKPFSKGNEPSSNHQFSGAKMSIPWSFFYDSFLDLKDQQNHKIRVASCPLAIKLFNRQKAQVTVATNVIVAPVAEAFEQRNLRKQRSTRDAQRWFRSPAIRM